MPSSTFSKEQIAYALRQAESGTAVADVCRQIGGSEATFDVWKKFAHLDVSEPRRMRQLASGESEHGSRRWPTCAPGSTPGALTADAEAA